jgi:hypothetical protein
MNKYNKLIYCRGFPYNKIVHDTLESNNNILYPRYIEILKYDNNSEFKNDYYILQRIIKKNDYDLKMIRKICRNLLLNNTYLRRYLYVELCSTDNNVLINSFICNKCYNIYYSKFIILNYLLEYPTEIKEAIIYMSLDIYLCNNMNNDIYSKNIIKQFNNPIYKYIDSFFLINN